MPAALFKYNEADGHDRWIFSETIIGSTGFHIRRNIAGKLEVKVAVDNSIAENMFIGMISDVPEGHTIDVLNLRGGGPKSKPVAKSNPIPASTVFDATQVPSSSSPAPWVKNIVRFNVSHVVLSDVFNVRFRISASL